MGVVHSRVTPLPCLLSLWAFCSICISVAAPGLPLNDLESNQLPDERFDFSTFASSNSITNSNNTLVQFTDGTDIIGITSLLNELAAVTSDALVLYEFIADWTGVVKLVDRIPLQPRVHDKLLEFRFLNQSAIFLCDPSTCRVCALKAEHTCKLYSLRTKRRPNDHLAQVAVTLTSDGGVALRYVNADGGAAVLKYTANIASQSIAEPSQYANDVPIVTDHHVVGAFNRKGFTYFVGSARRPFEPLIHSEINQEAIVTSVRLTRVCDRDATGNLESRIDLALRCPHIGVYEDVQTTSAEYDVANDRLTVVFLSMAVDSAGWKRNSVCSFRMAQVDTAFESIWTDCQNTSFRASTEECYYAESAESLPKHCFAFTRLADGHAMTPCSRFGGNYNTKALRNCELHEFESLAYRYGWLEEFNAFEGTLDAVLPHNTGPVVAFDQVQGDGAIFALSDDGAFQRVSLHTATEPSAQLWSTSLMSKTKHSIAGDSTHNRMTFIDNNRVKFVNVSCAGLYVTCDSLEHASWADPLGCRWCAKSSGIGRIITPTDHCSDGAIVHICPPLIEHVNPSPSSRDSTLFEIYGDKFDRLGNLSISVCNETCIGRSVEHNKLACVLRKSFDKARDCSVSATGRLGDHGSYTVSHVRSSVETTIDNASTQRNRSSTRRLKAIASVIAVVILLLLIALIILLVRRYQARQKLKRKHADSSSCQIPLDGVNGNIFGHALAGSNEYSGYQGIGLPLTRFNPYGSLFHEIDTQLKIPLSNLHMDREIGKGNFGIVYHGTLRCGSKQSREVACKTIISHSDGMVSSVSEFVREGLIMAKFNHPNVVQLIGISLTESHFPLIITEYLSNGDLLSYITGPNVKLTYGELLNFGIQIAEGMAYLHNEKFIHRDLAARNCMLDTNLVVKISDFGLSRDVSRCGVYRAVNLDRGIPVGWMPIESLEEQQYTFKGDVWAYGVVLWELATLGRVPYEGFGTDAIRTLLKKGRRLEKPKGCPDLLFEKVMKVCWVEEPGKRPSFYELKEMMEDVVRLFREGSLGSDLLSNHYERVTSRSTATSPSSPIDFEPITTNL